MNTYLKDAGSNYLRMLTAIGCSLFLTRAMAVQLGIDDFGRWSLITSVFGLAMLLDMGLGTVAVKSAGSSAPDSEGSEILSTVFATFMLLSCAAFLIAVVATKWLTPAGSSTMEPMILLLGARFTIATLPWSVFRSILFAKGGMVKSNLVQSGVAIAYSVIAYVALQHGVRLTGLAALTLASAVVESALLVVLVKRIFPEIQIRLRFSFKALKPALSLGTASLLINIAGLILLKTDPIIVKAFLPFSQVALYAVGLRVSENIFMLCKQLVNALTPRALQAAAAGQPEILGQLYRKATRYVFSFGAALYLCCFFLGRTAIRTWLSDEFAPSAQTLNILLAAMVLSIPQLVGCNLLTFSGHHRIVAKMVVIGAILNIVASVILVQFTGMRGVALGTLFATIVVDLGMLVPAASRHFGFHWKDVVMDLLKVVTVPGFAQAAFLLGLQRMIPCTTLTGVFLDGSASLLVFAIVFLTVGIPRTERAAIFQQFGILSKPAKITAVEAAI